MRLIDADEIKYEVREKLGLGIDYGINESDVSYVAYKHQIDSMPTIDPVKWIPVSERLPEDGKYVLAYSADDDYMTVEAKHKFEAFQITHWMPLPEPWRGEKMSEEAWELFDLITSAYWGKQMYFAQTDGIIYSRKSGRYMSMDDAVSEFVSLLSWEGEEDE